MNSGPVAWEGLVRRAVFAGRARASGTLFAVVTAVRLFPAQPAEGIGVGPTLVLTGSVLLSMLAITSGSGVSEAGR